MKRHVFSVLLALTFVFTGLQAVFIPADAAASRGNAAPFETLPAELQNLEVKDDFVDSGATRAGFLQTVIGHVVLLHEDSGEAFFAAAGDAVFKHDTIFTLADSRCRVKFTTEDVITMGENAKLGLDEYIDNRPRKKKKSIFSMLRGKAMFYAVRLFKYRTTSTTVNTPTAVVGVRGTKFALEVRKAGEKTAASDPIYLADASDSGLRYLLGQNDADEPVLIARVFDGALGIKGTGQIDDKPETLVFKGQGLVVTPAGVEVPYEMSQQEIDQTNADTHVPAPGEEGAGEAVQKPPADGIDVIVLAAAGGYVMPDTKLADNAEDQVNTTTDQLLNIEVAIDTVPGPTTHFGYFSAMVTELTGGIPPKLPVEGGVYVSQDVTIFHNTNTPGLTINPPYPGRQNFDSDHILAIGIYQPDYDFIRLDGSTDFKQPFFRQLSAEDESWETPDQGTNLPVDLIEISHNFYQEWGYWTLPIAFPADGNFFLIDNKAYYILGDHTPDAAMSGFNGTGNFTGMALGTYYSVTGGTDMAGDFSCQVDFNTNSISNFNMEVTGDGKSAAITGATGGFNSGSSHFELNSNSGTWILSNGATPFNPPTYRHSSGSLYGPNAEHIGGAWAMEQSRTNGDAAVGIFQGDKQ